MRHSFRAVDHVTQHFQHGCPFLMCGRVEHIQGIDKVVGNNRPHGKRRDPPLARLIDRCKSQIGRHRNPRDAARRAPQGKSQNPH